MKLIDSSQNSIHNGEIINQESNQKVKYDVIHGKSRWLALQCQKKWSPGFDEIIERLSAQNLESEKLEIEFNRLLLGDAHWNWGQKALKYTGNQYEWFFLMIDNIPEAVEIIFHPRKSQLESGEVFYVEFLSTAPWNRNIEGRVRKYSGLGSILLRSSVRFSISTLKLKPGFNLHSLEQSEAYYKRIGMQHVPTEDKPKLKFFEMKSQKARSFLL